MYTYLYDENTQTHTVFWVAFFSRFLFFYFSLYLFFSRYSWSLGLMTLYIVMFIIWSFRIYISSLCLSLSSVWIYAKLKRDRAIPFRWIMCVRMSIDIYYILYMHIRFLFRCSLYLEFIYEIGHWNCIRKIYVYIWYVWSVYTIFGLLTHSCDHPKSRLSGQMTRELWNRWNEAFRFWLTFFSFRTFFYSYLE